MTLQTLLHQNEQTHGMLCHLPSTAGRLSMIALNRASRIRLELDLAETRVQLEGLP